MPRRDLSALIERARSAHGDAALARRAMALVDLTSLRGGETSGGDRGPVPPRRDARHGRRLHLCRARSARPARCSRAARVRLATVANFPHGGDDIAAARPRRRRRSRPAPTRSTWWHRSAPCWRAMSVSSASWSRPAGLPPAPGITLKLILETGVLARARPDHGRGAGRGDGGRRLPQDLDRQDRGRRHAGGRGGAAGGAAREAGGRVGFKAAGGIRTAADAAAYLLLADAHHGPGLGHRRERFRFGASSLLDDLLGQGGAGTRLLMQPCLPQEIIRAKRDGNRLAAEEIAFFVARPDRRQHRRGPGGGLRDGGVPARHDAARRRWR